jgi:hypothetical protein
MMSRKRFEGESYTTTESSPKSKPMEWKYEEDLFPNHDPALGRRHRRYSRTVAAKILGRHVAEHLDHIGGYSARGKVCFETLISGSRTDEGARIYCR